MRAAGGGSVVVFTSFHALGGEHHAHAYVAAKGALLTLARTMAASYAADGIRVNALAPGIVLTDRVQARVDADGVDLGAVTAHHPGAVGSPDDIARIAAFLASDDARMITGAVIPADGGLTAF
jgi:NAD(P)-dependent dehydrogenase (short-subunit alcohol dehydrogenase family)